MALSVKLQKLTIKPKSSGGKPFEVMFNPETYSLKYENTFVPCQAINTSGKEQIYSYSKPSDLALTLILDNTGVAGGSGGLIGLAALTKKKEVNKRVKEFLELTAEMDGKEHAPRRLSVEWGDLVFECYLKDVEIKYTLFNRSGIPIRAELNVSFVAHIPDKKRVKEENKSSPDLSHQKIVNVDDNLPLMAHQVYKDPTYYIQIAQANQLNHFRKLRAGTPLNFPPIEK